jgi:hypothetical protein
MSKKREARNKLIFGLLIAFLMVSSTIGFMYSGESSKKINGFKFIRTEQNWRVWVNEIDSYAYFRYLPNEINLDGLEFNFNKIKIFNENWDQNSLQRLQTLLFFKDVKVEIVDKIECNERTFILNNNRLDPTVTLEEKCFYLDGDSLKILDEIAYRVFNIK